MKSKELSCPGTLVVRYAPRDVRARLQQQKKPNLSAADKHSNELKSSTLYHFTL